MVLLHILSKSLEHNYYITSWNTNLVLEFSVLGDDARVSKMVSVTMIAVIGTVIAAPRSWLRIRDFHNKK